jgi:hypothetical protein
MWVEVVVTILELMAELAFGGVLSEKPRRIRDRSRLAVDDWDLPGRAGHLPPSKSKPSDKL